MPPRTRRSVKAAGDPAAKPQESSSAILEKLDAIEQHLLAVSQRLDSLEQNNGGILNNTVAVYRRLIGIKASLIDLAAGKRLTVTHNERLEIDRTFGKLDEPDIITAGKLSGGEVERAAQPEPAMSRVLALLESIRAHLGLSSPSSSGNNEPHSLN